MNKFVLYTFHSAYSSRNFWAYQLCLNFSISSPWQPDHLWFLLWKETTYFANKHPSFVYWAQPIPINLARILPLHKEYWTGDNACNLYKPCISLFSLEHNLCWYWICVPDCNTSFVQINTFCSLLQPIYFAVIVVNKSFNFCVLPTNFYVTTITLAMSSSLSLAMHSTWSNSPNKSS